MKKWIRWQGLGIFFVLVVLFSVIWFLLVDRAVEKLIERSGTKALGAKVELDKADVSLLPPGLKLVRLQVTNPDAPMRNAVEIANIAMALDPFPLLRRKVIIEEMALDGVRFNTARKTSGAVKTTPGAGPMSQAPPSAEAQKGSLPGKCGKFSLPDFKAIDVKKILDTEELASLKQIKDFQAVIQSEKDQWQAKLSALPGAEQFSEYKKKIDGMKSGKGGFGGLLGAAADVSVMKKQIQNDLNQIKSARSQLDAKTASFNGRFKRLKGISDLDVGRLKEKYMPSAAGMQNMGLLLFGDHLCQWSQKALKWYQKIKPHLKKGAQKEASKDAAAPLRGKGLDVRFTEKAPLPDFLIKTAQAGLILSMGDVRGTIRNITPDQDILGAPLTFTFLGEKLQNIGLLKLDGSVDHTRPSAPRQNVNLLLRALQIKDAPLSDASTLPMILKEAKATFKMNAALAENRINAHINADLESVNVSSSAAADTTLLAQSITAALADIRQIAAEADVTGPLHDYQLDIRSNLDAVVKQAVEKAIKQKITQFEKELRGGIMAKVKTPLGETQASLNGFGDIRKQLTRRLDMGGGLLKGVNLSF